VSREITCPYCKGTGRLAEPTHADYQAAIDWQISQRNIENKEYKIWHMVDDINSAWIPTCPPPPEKETAEPDRPRPTPETEVNKTGIPIILPGTHFTWPE
jgi:hypothetical protein